MSDIDPPTDEDRMSVLEEVSDCIHDLLDDATLAVIAEPITFKDVPVIVIGITYPDGASVPIAIALTEGLRQYMTGLRDDQLCEQCAAEEADHILAHVDLDAPIPFLLDQNNDNDKEGNSE